MTLREKWIGHIHDHVTGDPAFRRRVAPVAGTIVFGMVALLLVLSVMLDGVIGMTGFISAGASYGVGIPLLLGGLYFMMWSVFTFAEAGGTPVPINPPGRLVREGPYARMRNPMLAGMFLLLFGIGFLLASFTILLIFSPLFVIVNVVEVKAIEEPELEMRLGREYKEYKEKTPMFFPRLFGPSSQQR